VRRERTEDGLAYELRVDAPPEVVFGYLTDPARMTAWIGEAALLDPRPGGAFRLEFDPGRVVVGSYTEVVPHTRVAFTWGWEGGEPVAAGESVVEVTLEEDGEGTLVRLRHRGLPETWLEAHDEGWSRYLPRLEAVLRESGDGSG
jgi:uncharacterized protein YndB with AHSA1/START domain